MDELALFKQADWIYENDNPQEDEYSLYRASFKSDESTATLLICADTDAAVYLNGELIYFSIPPSYPDHPIVDKVEVKLEENNEMAVNGYYFGSNAFSTYKKGPAGIKWLIYKDGKIVSYSNSKDVVCQPHPHYVSHKRKMISPQLGYSYEWSEPVIGKFSWHHPVVVEDYGECELRINKKTEFKDRKPYTLTKLSSKKCLIDFGSETVGHLDLDFVSPIQQKILITYAEHREEEDIVYKIENRDFSVEFVAAKGKNVFLDTFRRLGCRYLEVYLEKEIDINYFGIREVKYPFDKVEYDIDDPLVKKIYDAAVYTLECCYHEHYEDCPWREQSLYAQDSYNQAMAGFICFKNTEQIKSSLKVISYDQRKDGLLSICSPSESRLTIPSFSLFYFFAVDEYLKKTNDIEFVKEIYLKLKSVLDVFLSQVDEKGLMYSFDISGTWNFYEWAPTLDGNLGGEQFKKADIIINALFVMTLQVMQHIASTISIDVNYSSLIERNKLAVKELRLT